MWLNIILAHLYKWFSVILFSLELMFFAVVIIDVHSVNIAY